MSIKNNFSEKFVEVLFFVIIITAFSMPIIYLQWHEILFLHFFCVILTFTLIKTLKLKEPRLALILSLLLGLGGLFISLLDRKKAKINSLKKSTKTIDITQEMIETFSVEYGLSEDIAKRTLEMTLNSAKEVVEDLKNNAKNRKMNVTFNENNNKHGEEKNFYENGNIKSICHWVDGVQEGEEKNFYENGNIKNIIHWVDGVQDGPAYSYDIKGHLMKKSNIVNGSYHGEQIEYYPSGNPKIKRVWINNFKSEKYEYNLDGNLLCRYAYDEEKTKQTIYNSKGEELKTVIKVNYGEKIKETIYDSYGKELKTIIKINAEGIDFEEIKVEKGVYDYLSYHNNGGKYIEFKNSIFKEIEWNCNSDIKDEFEMNDSSELNVYNKSGKSIKKFTVFLCPNKSYETVIIFEVNKNDLLQIENWLFTSSERIKHLMSIRSHFVNCVNDEIDLEKAPPVLLNSSSQDVLGYLANYVPEKEFALIRRWEDNTDYSFYDEVFVTCSESIKYRSDEELKNFPCSDNMNEEAREYKFFHPDYFYVYEKHMFESLEIYDERLKLEVETYKTNPLK